MTDNLDASCRNSEWGFMFTHAVQAHAAPISIQYESIAMKHIFSTVQCCTAYNPHPYSVRIEIPTRTWAGEGTEEKADTRYSICIDAAVDITQARKHFKQRTRKTSP